MMQKKPSTRNSKLNNMMEGQRLKQSQIGVIPEDWKVKEFSALFKVPLRNGLTRPTAVRGSGIKMVNMGELFAYDRIRNIIMERVPVSDKEKQDYLLSTGDLIFARQSLLISGVGKCSVFLEDDEEVTYEGHLIRVRLSEGYSPMFYYYFFKSERGRTIIQGLSEQVAASGIRGSDLAKIPVPVPSLPEQQSISKILSDLDSKIEINQQMNKTLEAIGKAIFKHWFIDFEFPNDEGKPYKSSGGEMVHNEDLEEQIPKGWKIGSILNCADILSGGTPKTGVAEYWGGEIPWVSARDVTRSQGSFILDSERTITQSGIDNSSAKLLPKNTTVVTARGVVGSYCMLSREMAINQTNYGLKAKPEGGDFFVFFSISNLVNQMKQRSYGTIFDTITTKTFDDMKVPIPPSWLIRSFEEKVGNIMTKILVNLQQSRSLDSIRNALLPKLMSGKIRVPVEVR